MAGELSTAIKEVRLGAPEVTKAFSAMAKAATEEGVLVGPAHQHDGEQPAHEGVEPGEDVRAQDLPDGARRPLRQGVDPTVCDALGDVGRAQPSLRVQHLDTLGGGCRVARPEQVIAMWPRLVAPAGGGACRPFGAHRCERVDEERVGGEHVDWS